jgi:hypothetical protein
MAKRREKKGRCGCQQGPIHSNQEHAFENVGSVRSYLMESRDMVFHDFTSSVRP